MCKLFRKYVASNFVPNKCFNKQNNNTPNKLLKPLNSFKKNTNVIKTTNFHNRTSEIIARTALRIFFAYTINFLKFRCFFHAYSSFSNNNNNNNKQLRLLVLFVAVICNL